MADDPARIIEDIQEDAREAGESEARWEAIDRRLAAMEDRVSNAAPSTPYDDSGLRAEIASVRESIETALASLAKPATAEAEHETEAEPEPEEPEPDETPEIAPQIDIKSASSAAVRPERAPRNRHPLFRGFGRR